MLFMGLFRHILRLFKEPLGSLLSITRRVLELFWFCNEIIWRPSGTFWEICWALSGFLQRLPKALLGIFNGFSEISSKIFGGSLKLFKGFPEPFLWLFGDVFLD